jgi:hypothetical protein
LAQRPQTPRRPGTAHPPHNRREHFYADTEDHGGVHSRYYGAQCVHGTIDFRKTINRAQREVASARSAEQLGSRGCQTTKDLDYTPDWAEEMPLPNARPMSRVRGFSFRPMTSSSGRSIRTPDSGASSPSASGARSTTSQASSTGRRPRSAGFTMDKYTTREQRAKSNCRGEAEASKLPSTSGKGASHDYASNEYQFSNTKYEASGVGARRDLWYDVKHPAAHIPTPRFSAMRPRGEPRSLVVSGSERNSQPIDLAPRARIKGSVNFAKTLSKDAANRTRSMGAVSAAYDLKVSFAGTSLARHVAGVSIARCTPRPPVERKLVSDSSGSIAPKYGAVEPRPSSPRFASQISRAQTAYHVRVKKSSQVCSIAAYDTDRGLRLTHPKIAREIAVGGYTTPLHTARDGDVE